MLHTPFVKIVKAYTYVFVLIIVDHEGMLNFKDAEWCKQNLAETLHEQQTESESESNAENLEPPRKKMARSNEVIIVIPFKFNSELKFC